MSADPPELWRPSVVAVVVDAAGKVLLGSNPEVNGHYHFPQGGVKSTERMEDALWRELWEETGLASDACRLVARFGGLRYRYRADNPKSAVWKGQEQCYFLLQCSQESPRIEPQRGREFSTFDWLPWRLLHADLFAPVKRKSIRPALEAFFPAAVEYSPEAVAERLSPRRYRLVCSEPVLRLHPARDGALFGGGKEEAAAELADLSASIREAQAGDKGRHLLLLFGPAGSGLGGAVRHMASLLSPLQTRCGLPLFDRPSPDFLWPLHAALPREGETVILSTSPYNELLKTAAPARQKRLAHLVDFETMLAEEGVHLIKAYLHVSQEKFLEKETDGMEPTARAEALAAWKEQNLAAHALLASTHHPAAPWYIVPSDRRWYRDLVLARLLLESSACEKTPFFLS